MYQRTPQAAVWTRPEDEARSPAAASREPSTAQQEQTLWAKVPYQARRGRCLAIRRRGDNLWVGIAGAPAIQWLPAKQVLTDEEAARWAATGF